MANAGRIQMDRSFSLRMPQRPGWIDKHRVCKVIKGMDVLFSIHLEILKNQAVGATPAVVTILEQLAPKRA